MGLTLGHLIPSHLVCEQGKEGTMICGLLGIAPDVAGGRKACRNTMLVEVADEPLCRR